MEGSSDNEFRSWAIHDKSCPFFVHQLPHGKGLGTDPGVSYSSGNQVVIATFMGVIVDMHTLSEITLFTPCVSQWPNLGS